MRVPSARKFIKLIASLTVFAMCAATLPGGMGTIAFAQTNAGKAQPAGDYAWQTAQTGILGGFKEPNIFAGYQFTPDSDGYVSELCGFYTGTHFVSLYDETFNLITSASISSYEQWNCAIIDPVAVTKGKNYYVAAEIAGGPAYFRGQTANFLPVCSGQVTIVRGVSQPIAQPFGKELKTYDNLIPGMADIKFSKSKQIDIFKKAGASLADAVPAVVPTETSGTVEWDSNELVRNCASGKCISCGSSGCKITDRRGYKNPGRINLHPDLQQGKLLQLHHGKLRPYRCRGHCQKRILFQKLQRQQMLKLPQRRMYGYRRRSPQILPAVGF